MEGFMFRLHPQTLRLGELLSGGVIGGVRQVVAEFGHRLDDPTDVRGIGSLGGGSLGDVGCYCVSAIRLAFGAEPRRASAFARFDEEGADRELAGALEFDEGLGIVSSSISSARRERMEIVGEEGRITLDAPFRADKAGGTMEVLHSGETSTETFEGADPYRAELEEFTTAIRDGRDPTVGPREILGNARAIGALLGSARSGGRAVDL
jgi:predicted dehydrogenase